nr:hypothetical protein [uncultured Cohaesibacter sp.]
MTTQNAVLTDLLMKDNGSWLVLKSKLLFNSIGCIHIVYFFSFGSLWWIEA